MYEVSLSISPAGCGQIVTMFIPLNRMVNSDEALPSISPVCRGYLMKMLITLKQRDIF